MYDRASLTRLLPCPYDPEYSRLGNFQVSGFGLDRANEGQCYSALEYPSSGVFDYQDAIKYFGRSAAQVKGTYRNDPKVRHVIIPKWVWHGVTPYQGLIQGVPKTVTEIQLIKFCKGYGKVHSFLLEKGNPYDGYEHDDPEYHMHNGRFMVKYYDSANLVSLAAACDQQKGGYEIPGHARSKLFFKCTWIDFLSYRGTRQDNNTGAKLGSRRKWDVRYDCFDDFSDEALHEDDWLYHRCDYDNSNSRNFVIESRDSPR